MRHLWAAALALAILILHASPLRSWIVNDAGISFAYARSLAAGHGLVAQSGAEPVEGFTNLLWVLLLAPAMAAGVFDPVVTPKLMAGFAAAYFGDILPNTFYAKDAEV